MEPPSQGGAVKKRVSKLKPPKNYSSKYGSSIPKLISPKSSQPFIQEDKSGKEACDTPDIVSSCDSKVTIDN